MAVRGQEAGARPSAPPPQRTYGGDVADEEHQYDEENDGDDVEEDYEEEVEEDENDEDDRQGAHHTSTSPPHPKRRGLVDSHGRRVAASSGRPNGGVAANETVAHQTTAAPSVAPVVANVGSTPSGSAKVHVTHDGSKGRLLSCTECRRRKTRCDKRTPCGPCILRNDEARCKQIIRWESGCSLTEFQMLANRVADLESRLEDICGRLNACSSEPAAAPADRATAKSAATVVGGGLALAASGSASGAGPSTFAPAAVSRPISAAGQGGRAGTGQTNGIASSTHAPHAVSTGPGGGGGGRDGGDDAAVMMLEDFAMGNRVNLRRAAQTLAADADGHAHHVPSAEASATTTQRSADGAAEVAARFLALAPAPDICREMVAYYFDRLDWYTKCLHRPMYEAEAEVLLQLEPNDAARKCRPAFVCMHLMVLCLALHLCAPEEVERWGMTVPVASAVCDAFFAGAQQLLWASDFVGSHQIEHLQAVILLSVFAYNVDDSDASYALVGAAIKIAQNLGLNRLDDARTLGKLPAGGGVGAALGSGLFGGTLGAGKGVQMAGGTAPGGAHGGGRTAPPHPADREIKKRVWWYLVWLDYTHAIAHGGAYSIHPAHNHTLFPANVDDDALSSGGLLSPKPLGEYTDASFIIWRLKILDVYREIIDLHNAPRGMAYRDVVEMDKKLSGLLEQLPAHFQLPIHDRRHWPKTETTRDLECLSIQLTAHNRLLRLHRPYLIRGFSDRNSPSSQSTRRCVAAAFAILEIMRHAKLHAPLVLKTWIHIYYGFGGALVIFLALCYESEMHSHSAEEKRAAVREMADICSTAAHLSHAAKNTASLLRGLLDAEQELRRRPTSTAGARHQRDVSRGKAGVASSTSAELTHQPQQQQGKRKRGTSAAKEREEAPSGAPFLRLVERVLIDAASRDQGLSRSASDQGFFEPPHMRHSTSFARESHDDRALLASTGGRGGLFENPPGSTGAGYFGGINGSTGAGMVPLSPWGGSSSSGGRGSAGPRTMGGASADGADGPSLGAASAGSTSARGVRSGSSALGTGPLSHMGGGGVGPMGAGVALGGHAGFRAGVGGSPSAVGGLQAASGLSNLLDEDIFSGLLMGNALDASDWETALALVAPPPTAQPAVSISSTSFGPGLGGAGANSSNYAAHAHPPPTNQDHYRQGVATPPLPSPEHSSSGAAAKTTTDHSQHHATVLPPISPYGPPEHLESPHRSSFGQGSQADRHAAAAPGHALGPAATVQPHHAHHGQQSHQPHPQRQTQQRLQHSGHVASHYPHDAAPPTQPSSASSTKRRASPMASSSSSPSSSWRQE